MVRKWLYLLESEDSEDSADIIMWPKTRIINGFEVPAPRLES